MTISTIGIWELLQIAALIASGVAMYKDNGTMAIYFVLLAMALRLERISQWISLGKERKARN